MVVDRQLLSDIVSDMLAASGRVLPEWRTMYGNIAGMLGEYADDVKVRRQTDAIPDGPFMSSHDSSVRWLVPLLRKRFPTPSPYEMAA
jgi:hypothetical protein